MNNSASQEEIEKAWRDPASAKLLEYKEIETACTINWWAIGGIIAFVVGFVMFMLWGG